LCQVQIRAIQRGETRMLSFVEPPWLHPHLVVRFTPSYRSLVSGGCLVYIRHECAVFDRR
jgi:hypothetical protein